MIDPVLILVKSGCIMIKGVSVEKCYERSNYKGLDVIAHGDNVLVYYNRSGNKGDITPLYKSNGTYEVIYESSEIE